MEPKKSFGLIIPKKSDGYRPKRSAIFGSDSDDEPPKRPSIPQAKKIPQKLITAEESVDPSIYEYDNIYDDMKAEQVSASAPKSNKPSRYIESLLKAAEKRKKDDERRVERKVHREREQEGDKFRDKEAFVTTSYKKKMLEWEEEEERERRENALNEMMDVTKQKDLSGFYRHFLKQSVGEEKIPVFGERGAKIKEEILSDGEGKEPSEKNLDRDSDWAMSSDEEISNSSARKIHSEAKDAGTVSEAENKKQRTQSVKFSSQQRKVKPQNIRRPTKDKSDSESDQSRSPLHHSYPKKKSPNEQHKKSSKSDSESSCSSDSSHAKVDKPTLSKSTHPTKVDSETLQSKSKDESSPKEKENISEEPKKNIYEKRTVGVKFTEAQARYFQRMAVVNV